MDNLLEQIEILKARTDISYAEAKETLELCNYDVVAALVHLEQQNKVKAKSSNEKTFFATIKDVIVSTVRAGNEHRFVIKKAETTVINVTVTIMVLSLIFMLPGVVLGVLAALFTGHKIRFVKGDGNDFNLNQAFDKLADATSGLSDKVVASMDKK